MKLITTKDTTAEVSPYIARVRYDQGDFWSKNYDYFIDENTARLFEDGVGVSLFEGLGRSKAFSTIDVTVLPTQDAQLNPDIQYVGLKPILLTEYLPDFANYDGERSASIHSIEQARNITYVGDASTLSAFNEVMAAIDPLLPSDNQLREYSVFTPEANDVINSDLPDLMGKTLVVFDGKVSGLRKISHLDGLVVGEVTDDGISWYDKPDYARFSGYDLPGRVTQNYAESNEVLDVMFQPNLLADLEVDSSMTL